VVVHAGPKNSEKEGKRYGRKESKEKEEMMNPI
jgi:hypothetical protein